MFNERTQSNKAIFNWVHFNTMTNMKKNRQNRENSLTRPVGQMKTDYMQLLPTGASTGYENSASSANKIMLIQLNLHFCQRTFQTRRILKFGVYIETR